MSASRFRLAHKRARTAEDGDIERDAGFSESAGGGRPRRLGDKIAQSRGGFRIGFPGEFQNMLRGIRLASQSAKFESSRPHFEADPRATRYRHDRVWSEGRAILGRAWSFWRNRPRS